MELLGQDNQSYVDCFPLLFHSLFVCTIRHPKDVTQNMEKKDPTMRESRIPFPCSGLESFVRTHTTHA
jgi:hypothetical protein